MKTRSDMKGTKPMTTSPAWVRPGRNWRRVDGLLDHLQNPPQRPSLLDDEAFAALSADELERYDAARINFISTGITIKTAAAAEATKYVRIAGDCNDGGRFGLLVSGQANTGKTTLCDVLMRSEFNRFVRLFPGAIDEGAVPVVFVEVPAGSNGKQFLHVFLDFFGLRYRATETQVQLQTRVIDALQQAGTVLVIIDEIHRLKGRTAGLGESIDVLRSMTQSVDATFVLAGIKLNDNALFHGDRGEQLASRFSMLQLAPTGYAGSEARTAWVKQIRDIERALPLRHHRVGTMAKIAGELHQRTSGSLPALTRLLYAAATEAIRSRKITTELIAPDLLLSQKLDYANQAARAARSAKKNAPLTLRSYLDVYDSTAHDAQDAEDAA
jgi:hypothetical protein